MQLAYAMQKICRTAAAAVCRYAAVSATSPGKDLPERFVTAFVCDRLGYEMTITLETNARKLLDWDLDLRTKLKLPLPENPDEEFASSVAALGYRPRVDMVLWSSDSDR